MTRPLVQAQTYERENGETVVRMFAHTHVTRLDHKQSAINTEVLAFDNMIDDIDKKARELKLRIGDNALIRLSVEVDVERAD